MQEELEKDVKMLKESGNGYIIVFVENGKITDKRLFASKKDTIDQKRKAIQLVETLSNGEAAWAMHQVHRSQETAKRTKKIFEAAGIERNWDMTPFELNKEYAWKDFFTWDEKQKKVPQLCMFKVTKMEQDKEMNTISGTWCHVTYSKGPYAGTSVTIPLEDMPPTVEKRA